MGDIADAMLDGTLCEWCGCYVETGGQGFPMLCADCYREADPKQKKVYAYRHEIILSAPEKHDA
jgi:hypothetical protein